MTWMPPFGTFAICRIAAMVPIGAEVGRLRLVRCRWSAAAGRSADRPPGARFTASIDIGRLIASGCSVSGKTTVCAEGQGRKLARDRCAPVGRRPSPASADALKAIDMIAAWRSTNATSSTTKQRNANRQAHLSALQARQRLPDALGRPDAGRIALPPGADERDRALCGKLRDYMIRDGRLGDLQDLREEVRYSFAALDGVHREGRRAAPGAGRDHAGGDDEDSRFNTMNGIDPPPHVARRSGR